MKGRGRPCILDPSSPLLEEGRVWGRVGSGPRSRDPYSTPTPPTRVGRVGGPWSPRAPEDGSHVAPPPVPGAAPSRSPRNRARSRRNRPPDNGTLLGESRGPLLPSVTRLESGSASLCWLVRHLLLFASGKQRVNTAWSRIRSRHVPVQRIHRTRASSSGSAPTVYAVYAISSLDTGSPLRPRARIAVGTYQRVAGLAPRPFTLGEETGSRCLCCLCN